MTGDFTSKFNRYTEKSGEQKLQPTKTPIRISDYSEKHKAKIAINISKFPVMQQLHLPQRENSLHLCVNFNLSVTH